MKPLPYVALAIAGVVTAALVVVIVRRHEGGALTGEAASARLAELQSAGQRGASTIRYEMCSTGGYTDDDGCSLVVTYRSGETRRDEHFIGREASPSEISIESPRNSLKCDVDAHFCQYNSGLLGLPIFDHASDPLVDTYIAPSELRSFPRAIAGRTATCFSHHDEAGNAMSCYDGDGRLLYTETRGHSLLGECYVETMEAIEVTDSAPDGIFKPPYAVTPAPTPFSIIVQFDDITEDAGRTPADIEVAPIFDPTRAAQVQRDVIAHGDC